MPSQEKILGLFSFVAVMAVYYILNNRKRQRIRKVYGRLERVKSIVGPFIKKDKEAPRDEDSVEKASKGRVMANTAIDEIRLHDIDKLSQYAKSVRKENACWHGVEDASNDIHSYSQIIEDEEYIIGKVTRKPNCIGSSEAFVRAGPRAVTHFDPIKVTAAIVCCGGLCPGLNNVIREVVHTLHNQYAVDKVWGIRGGFHGFSNGEGCDSPKSMKGGGKILLSNESVADIHHQGGTILSSSRGGFDADLILNFLISNGISQLYIIGGDGTHRAANKLCQACEERKLNIAIVGIPKTIDNDVDLIDRSFGFQTSVEAAQAAILSAKVEARCNYPNGIGIVELMGRHSGLIAGHATLSSGDVDLCLVPEVETPFDGECNALSFLKHRVEKNGHAVVVVAEGFGEVFFNQPQFEGNNEFAHKDESGNVIIEKDAGGNRKLPPIGPFLKKLVEKYFKDHGSCASVKYIDPSYMVRSVPANASDSLYCMLLGQNAVHGAMAGYTNFSTGLINNRMCYIPIPRIVATSPRGLDPHGRTWERILSITRQPQKVEIKRRTSRSESMSIDADTSPTKM